MCVNAADFVPAQIIAGGATCQVRKRITLVLSIVCDVRKTLSSAPPSTSRTSTLRELELREGAPIELSP